MKSISRRTIRSLQNFPYLSKKKSLELSLCKLVVPCFGWGLRWGVSYVGQKSGRKVGAFYWSIHSCLLLQKHGSQLLLGFCRCLWPNMDHDRCLLWNELVDLHSLWDVPWCISENFNVMRLSCEHSNHARLCPPMQNFFEFIFDLSLVDLPLMNGTFTCSSSNQWSRLDRFHVSSAWESHFSNVCQKCLPRLCLDHFPIVLDCGGIQRGHWYF